MSNYCIRWSIRGNKTGFRVFLESAILNRVASFCASILLYIKEYIAIVGIQFFYEKKNYGSCWTHLHCKNVQGYSQLSNYNYLVSFWLLMNFITQEEQVAELVMTMMFPTMQPVRRSGLKKQRILLISNHLNPFTTFISQLFQLCITAMIYHKFVSFSTFSNIWSFNYVIISVDRFASIRMKTPRGRKTTKTLE